MANKRNTSASVANSEPSAITQASESLTTSLLGHKSEEIVAPPAALTVTQTPLDGHCRGLMSILFFLCGLGSSLCYISILSCLVYFSSEYGDSSFVYLNIAAFLPDLPISIIQARYDQLYDAEYGSKNSFLFRGVAGYIICIGAMAAAPLRIGLLWVCSFTFLMGLAGTVLQNVLFQMTAFVLSSTDLSGANSLKTAVSAGVQGSAFFALVISVLIGLGGSVHTSREHFKIFCIVICSIEAVILLLFLGLMKHGRVATSMVRRDSSFFLVSQDDETDPNNVGDTIQDTGLGKSQGTLKDISMSPTELTYRQLWSHTSSISMSLFLTLVPSFLVGSWFTMIKTANVMLPKILFYVRIGADFIARFVAGYKPPSSVRELLFLSICRILLVVAFFFNASFETFQYGDILSIVLVAIIAFGSGYLVTGCYQLAPSQLPDEAKEQNATKQAALLNVAFSFSALLGVLTSLGLTYLDTTTTPS